GPGTLEVHGIVTPLSRSNLAAIEIEDGSEFRQIEAGGHWRPGMGAGMSRDKVDQPCRAALRWFINHFASRCWSHDCGNCRAMQAGAGVGGSSPEFGARRLSGAR